MRVHYYELLTQRDKNTMWHRVKKLAQYVTSFFPIKLKVIAPRVLHTHTRHAEHVDPDYTSEMRTLTNKMG